MIGPKIHDRCFAKQHVLNEDFIDMNKTPLQGQFKIFHLTTKRFGILQTTRTCGNLVFITYREKRVVSRNTDHEFSDRSWFRSVTHTPNYCFVYKCVRVFSHIQSTFRSTAYFVQGASFGVNDTNAWMKYNGWDVHQFAYGLLLLSFGSTLPTSRAQTAHSWIQQQ